MPSSYSPLLRLELMQTGEKSATWGDITNTNLGTLLEKGIAGTASIDVTVGNVTLTSLNGADDEARCLIISVSGTPGVSRNITAPASSKAYVLLNGSNGAVVFKASATTGVTIAAGEKAFLAWGGSDFVRVTGPTASPSFTGTTTVEQLTVGGATVLGDAPGDTVSVAGASISWTGNPTHSGNHTFSGNVAVQGSTTLGNSAASDTLNVDAIASFSGNVTIGNPLNTAAHVINAATVTLNGTPSWRWNSGAYTLDFAGVGLVCNTTITTTAGGFATNGSVQGSSATFSGNTLPQLLVDRPGAATNALTNYRTTAGSIYVGHGATNTWAIGSTTDLSSSPWFEVTSQLTLARGALLTNASTFGGLGYTIGAGGSVTQATSKSTAVTVNAWSGAITTTAAALAGGARVSFTVNNSNVTANDVPIVSLRSGGTVDSYIVSVTAVAAGSFRVQIANLTGGSLSEALVINFAIIRAALS